MVISLLLRNSCTGSIVEICSKCVLVLVIELLINLSIDSIDWGLQLQIADYGIQNTNTSVIYMSIFIYRLLLISLCDYDWWLGGDCGNDDDVVG